MRTKLFPRITVVVMLGLFLGACSGQNTQALKYPFPTTLPSGKVLEENFQALHHDLSPLPAYRFRIQIPKDWKVIDTRITKAPAKDAGPSDVAVFRQPGAWMTDATSPIKGEISVSVVNVSGSMQSPSDWLQAKLQKNAKGFTLVSKREVPSASGPVADMLITYIDDSQTLVSRMMAFRSGSNMFILTGSDTADEYPQNAEAFYVAITTFRLDSAGKTAPPESDSSVAH